MVYSTLTIGTKVGVRLKGVEHLKKFCAWVEKKYDIPAQVLGNVVGMVYQNHVMLEFKDMEHFEKFNDKLLSDPEYTAWFKEGSDLLEWAGVVQHVYNVL